MILTDLFPAQCRVGTIRPTSWSGLETTANMHEMEYTVCRAWMKHYFYMLKASAWMTDYTDINY